MTKKLLYLFLFLTISITSFAQVANQPNDYVVCDDDNDGFALFDLTYVDAQVLGSQQSAADYTVTYHETLLDAENNFSPIVFYPYVNNTDWLQIIYVRLEDNNTGSYDITTVNLIVNPFPQAIQPTSLDLCDDVGEVGDEIAVFDLTIKDVEITGSNANWSVAYYETNADAQAQTNAISNPIQYTNYTNPQTLYAVVTEATTGCIGFATLTIRVNPNPTPTQSELLPDLVLCDEINTGDGVETFDLTQNETLIRNGEANIWVAFFVSENDAMSASNSISDPSEYTNTVSPQTIYARVTNNTTGCFAVVDFEIIVNPLPAAVAVTDFIQCEVNTDGFAEFDLISKDAEVLNGQDPSQFDVFYYMNLTDAYSGVNALPSPYTNISNPQQVFVTIINNSTGCSISVQSFNIEVQEAAQANPNMLLVCDDNMETDGNPSNDSVQIDLTSMDQIVLNGQNPNYYMVSYYPTELDADYGSNPLPMLYENITNPQVIYVRVENDTQNGTGNDTSSCYAISEVMLEVSPLPFLNIESSYSFCVGESLTIDTGLTNSYYSFQWILNGNSIPNETQPFLTVTQPGSYEVSVISLLGCGITTTITNVEEVICTDTDNDGVIDSDEDLNNNGNLEDDDTDDDGTPNYLDNDDDGDNVDTSIEINIVLGRNTIHPFVDTDNDNIENYLDDDDDGDNVLTKDEDYNNNGDPTDDDTNNNSIPDYLESTVALSVNDYSLSNFKMYPNPAKGEVNIQLASSNFGTGKINVFDIQGKMILKDIKFQEETSTLDISNLESGLYFVELIIGNKSTVQKLIVN